MRNRDLMVLAVILFGALTVRAQGVAASEIRPTNSPVLIHEWVVDTGLGNVGYTDMAYILDAPKADGTDFRDRFIHLGPLGSYRTGMSGPVVCALAGILVLLIAGMPIAWIARRKKEPS